MSVSYQIKLNVPYPDKYTTIFVNLDIPNSITLQKTLLYLVPNNLSPASPRPGTMYPSSFNFSSIDAK